MIQFYNSYAIPLPADLNYAAIFCLHEYGGKESMRKALNFQRPEINSWFAFSEVRPLERLWYKLNECRTHDGVYRLMEECPDLLAYAKKGEKLMEILLEVSKPPTFNEVFYANKISNTPTAPRPEHPIEEGVEGVEDEDDEDDDDETPVPPTVPQPIVTGIEDLIAYLDGEDETF